MDYDAVKEGIDALGRAPQIAHPPLDVPLTVAGGGLGTTEPTASDEGGLETPSSSSFRRWSDEEHHEKPRRPAGSLS
jgi:hypothetical protein